jgi:anion transporter
MKSSPTKKATGYDKYVDWRIFIIPVVLFIVILLLPTPDGMKDVGMEYQLGNKAVTSKITTDLFHINASDALQWQILVAQIMAQNMKMGALSRDRFLKRNLDWCKKYNIPVDEKNLNKALNFINEQVTEKSYETLMIDALKFLKHDLNYHHLSDKEKAIADKGAWHIKVAIAMTVFVVICFFTECMPLPGVAFCIGLILVFSGVISRTVVAQLYWSDACWFIMGSLMFAAAFVKTGVDKRFCLIMFRKLAVPSVKWITLIFFLIISPLAAFISDHALAAMFLPIGMLLYQNSLSEETPQDPELAKMLMITIAFACNIGGPGAPSGGARNVIMMTYLSDMFGYDIGYFQWMTYCFPFVLVMIPITWFMLNFQFKPKVQSLAPAMNQLKYEIKKMGGWNKKQIWALVIFVIMVFGWFTEKSFYNYGIYPIRLGIGVIAIAGAVGYLLTGVVNWRDYQEKVDWGVVWLYAGAIIFGRTLDTTGAAYWMARSVLEVLTSLSIESGTALMLISNCLTSCITNLMADGPAAAAVGPISLNLAAIAHPGTVFIPFMAMATAIASSFAYCLIIGTPPNAIVYASGYLEPKDFFRVGIPLFIVANVVLFMMSAVYWGWKGFSGLPGI